MADEVESFAAQARRFCTFVERAHRLGLGERLRVAARETAALHAAALTLPHVEVTAPGIAEPEVSPPHTWPGMGPAEHYWMVFDPYEGGAAGPCTGTLSDDLLDMYLDLERGLQVYARGDDDAEQEAAWIWRVSFELHWGRHAANALAALHQASSKFCSPLGWSAQVM